VQIPFEHQQANQPQAKYQGISPARRSVSQRPTVLERMVDRGLFDLSSIAARYSFLRLYLFSILLYDRCSCSIVVTSTHALSAAWQYVILCLALYTLISTYTVSQKVSYLMFVNNFGKSRPIFIMLSPVDSQETSLCILYTKKIPPHLQYVVTLPCEIGKSKGCYWFWQHPQQTVDISLRTLWTLDVTFNSSYRQTVSRLLTLMN